MKNTHHTSPATKCCAFAVLVLCTLLLLPVAERPVQAADAAKVWTGSWNNRKYNTRGSLVCTVTSQQGNIWQAVFTGIGLNRQFRYPATLTARQAGGRTTLTGVTEVDSERYQWSGAISGRTLTGSYRSATGNNGSFSLVSR